MILINPIVFLIDPHKSLPFVAVGFNEYVWPFVVGVEFELHYTATSSSAYR
ncbi:MAG: hypothetical protein U5K79_23670 [Cyclobacteriaceae bacterium]|nr:hypothetical protein [Cyclobacteriaceae bacterium]